METELLVIYRLIRFRQPIVLKFPKGVRDDSGNQGLNRDNSGVFRQSVLNRQRHGSLYPSIFEEETAVVAEGAWNG